LGRLPKTALEKTPGVPRNPLDGFAEDTPDDLPPARREKYEPSGRIIL